MRNLTRVVSVAAICLAVTACATQPSVNNLGAPGFFTGLWHGWVAPFALFSGIFTDIKVYEFPNSGWFYDFGFMFGSGSLGVFGWCCSSSGDKKKGTK
jgi:hypothetical protein